MNRLERDRCQTREGCLAAFRRVRCRMFDLGYFCRSCLTISYVLAAHAPHIKKFLYVGGSHHSSLALEWGLD